MSKGIIRLEGGVGISILVQPKARKNEISGWLDGRLKIRLMAPPVEGKANKALVVFLAKRLKVSKSRISIVGGEKNRRKEVVIEGLTPGDAAGLVTN